MEDKISAKFIVKGLVQGVGFRYFAYRKASELGLYGFAENLSDGSVLSEVEGEKNSIEKYREYLKQGPSRAIVESVEVEYGEFENRFSSFYIR